MSASRAFPRRFLSLWMPFLSTDRVRRQRGQPPLDADEAVVLVAKTKGTQRIMAVDRLAQTRGLGPGMALAQARAMVPALRALSHDADADARLLEIIADWADRYTPLVGRDPPHGLLLDITGAAHLKGGEGALMADLTGRLARQGLGATAAIAPTVGAAWALSRHANLAGAILAEEVTRAGLDASLAQLPVSALRLAGETTAALHRVGLKRVGDLIGRPRSALAARFGAAVIVQLDRARGIDTEAISPRQPVPPAAVEHGFAEPILTTAAVEQTCRLLTERLAALLEDRGQGATALELTIYRVDGLSKRIPLRLASPCRAAKTMADLLVLRLGHLDDPLDPGFGYDLVRLAATAVAARGAEARRLVGLDDLHEWDASTALASVCAPLIDRLAARFGPGVIRTIALADTHIPEQAARLMAPSGRPPAPAQNAQPPEHDWRQRPPRLLDPPEPAEVIAEVPDGPPIQLRWRRRQLRIVSANGPERIAPEWWRTSALPPTALIPAALIPTALIHERNTSATRDYWRVEDATGRRLWLYREGFYGTPEMAPEMAPEMSQETSKDTGIAPRPPRWYVHGLFA